jgi:hypothetical protein
MNLTALNKGALAGHPVHCRMQRLAAIQQIQARDLKIHPAIAQILQ